jgi:hypothetical protein
MAIYPSREVKISSAVDLLSTYGTNGADMKT